MRNVYCKVDNITEAKSCTKILGSKLEKCNLPVEYDSEGTGFICNKYDVNFIPENQWEKISITKGGTGYLTIPYNRMLNNPNGVKKEQCNLPSLIKLIKAGF